MTALSPLNTIFAQGKQITGTVTSSENKQPVASVTVTVKGTKNATTTDAQGNYKITVDSKATTLVFSSASFIAFESAINGRTVINVELIAEVKAGRCGRSWLFYYQKKGLNRFRFISKFKTTLKIFHCHLRQKLCREN